MFRAFVAECERADHSMNLEGKGLTEERTRQITLQRNKLRTLATNAKKVRLPRFPRAFMPLSELAFSLSPHSILASAPPLWLELSFGLAHSLHA